jgi:hypothetical protein
LAKRAIPLGKKTVKTIFGIVDNVFNVLKARFLGPGYITKDGGKAIIIGYKEHLSLPAMYAAAAREEATKPDKDVLANLTAIADSYMEVQRERAKTAVLERVNKVLNEDPDNVQEALEAELQSVWQNTQSDLVKIAESQLQIAKNMGSLEGIVKVSASLGVEDPNVAFLGPLDEHTCKECRKTFWTDDLVPRVWKLSEVQHGYYVRGTFKPCISGCHPSCRSTIVYISKGYGFDQNGKIQFKSLDHDEYDRQRS